MANLEQWVSDRLHDILGLSDRYVSQFMIGTARKASSPEDFVARLEQTGTIDIDQSVAAFAKELFEKVHSWNSTRVPCDVHQNSFSFSSGGLKKPSNVVLLLQVPHKQVVEKPSRAVERQAIEMERKNRTYTLLEDSDDADEDAAREKQKGKKKSKDKERGNKRKHIRQKKGSESSSEEEAPKR